jgi:hypothetical protein
LLEHHPDYSHVGEHSSRCAGRSSSATLQARDAGRIALSPSASHKPVRLWRAVPPQPPAPALRPQPLPRRRLLRVSATQHGRRLRILRCARHPVPYPEIDMHGCTACAAPGLGCNRGLAPMLGWLPEGARVLGGRCAR